MPITKTVGVSGFSGWLIASATEPTRDVKRTQGQHTIAGLFPLVVKAFSDRLWTPALPCN